MSNFNAKRPAERDLTPLPVQKKHQPESQGPKSLVRQVSSPVTSELSPPLQSDMPLSRTLTTPFGSLTQSDQSPSQSLSLFSPISRPQTKTIAHENRLKLHHWCEVSPVNYINPVPYRNREKRKIYRYYQKEKDHPAYKQSARLSSINWYRK